MSRPLEHRSAARRLRSALFFCVPLAACFDPTSQPGNDVDAGTGADASSSDDGGALTHGSDDGASTPSTTEPGSSSATAPGTTEPGDDSSGGGDSDPTATATHTGGDESESSGSPGSSDDGGVPACEGQCAPEVPQGWQGPVVVYDGADAAPPCPGEYPQVVHADQRAGLEEGAAVCECECGGVVGASCGAATLREEGNLCLAFVMNPDTYVLQPGACTAINAPANDYSLTPPALQTAGSSCAPQATEAIDAPSWDRHVRSCGTAAGDACDGGTCFPGVPADHSMCIWVEGEAACPAGPWTQVLVTYAEAIDGRDCTACTCGAPTGSCGGDAYLTNNGCAGNAVLVDVMPAGGCGDVGSATHGMWVPEVDASCAPSGGALSGEIAVEGAVTYCCL